MKFFFVLIGASALPSGIFCFAAHEFIWGFVCVFIVFPLGLALGSIGEGGSSSYG